MRKGLCVIKNSNAWANEIQKMKINGPAWCGGFSAKIRVTSQLAITMPVTNLTGLSKYFVTVNKPQAKPCRRAPPNSHIGKFSNGQKMGKISKIVHQARPAQDR